MLIRILRDSRQVPHTTCGARGAFKGDTKSVFLWRISARTRLRTPFIKLEIVRTNRQHIQHILVYAINCPHTRYISRWYCAHAVQWIGARELRMYCERCTRKASLPVVASTVHCTWSQRRAQSTRSNGSGDSSLNILSPWSHRGDLTLAGHLLWVAIKLRRRLNHLWNSLKKQIICFSGARVRVPEILFSISNTPVWEEGTAVQRRLRLRGLQSWFNIRAKRTRKVYYLKKKLFQHI